MTQITIKIMPDGAQKIVYKDDHPILAGREFNAERASHVNFDAESQSWKVYLPNGSLLIEDGFANRGEAIAAEIKALDRAASTW